MMTPGTRLGVYELVAPLGAGGMGEVHRARDTRLGREVALKLLPAAIAADPAGLSRFEQEARCVAAVNHPNIVGLFDIGREGPVAYMVTELVDGSTLRGARLPVRKVTEVGAQIADALAAAHAAGVTHRDIKPDNVMLTRDGRVKVLDFGVAKVSPSAGDEGLTVAQTAIGSVVGTVGYMAPEQVRGEPMGPRTDIFAVGALLYELLQGAPAFDGETPAEVMTATLRSDPADLPSGVPEPVRQIVHRCLEKDPGERFQSARDLSFALRRLAGSSTAALRLATQPRRADWRLALALSALILGGLLAGGAFRWVGSAQDGAIDPIQLTRVTSDRRNELAPSFSPDRTLAEDHDCEGSTMTTASGRQFGDGGGLPTSRPGTIRVQNGQTRARIDTTPAEE